MVDFTLTDEQKNLREMAHDFAVKEIRPVAWEYDKDGTWPQDIIEKAWEVGLMNSHIEEAYGGAGAGYLDGCLIEEELSWGCSGIQTSLGCNGLATAPIALGGSEEVKKKYLGALTEAPKLASFCLTEPDAGSDVSGIKTRAVKDGDDYVINGSKTYITNGHRADVIVLVTKTDPDAGYDGFTLFLVPMDAPGVIREKKLEKLGMHASDTALLAFQDVRVPSTAVLGQVGKGFYHIMWELQGERLIGAAGMVAGAQKCFERTLQYAHERKAFGREIGKFQVIRHKFAEMATKIESARQMTYITAWRFNNGEYPVREISMAKLHASRVLCEVADDCIQIHGGAGYMREYGVERVWRDARLNRIGAGTDEIMLDVIGRSYGL
jgi:alkylation response protein AidB-like acyl-CoA dehydrogenase